MVLRQTEGRPSDSGAAFHGLWDRRQLGGLTVSSYRATNDTATAGAGAYK